jgi:hypothetical protein
VFEIEKERGATCEIIKDGARRGGGWSGKGSFGKTSDVSSEKSQHG